MKSVQEFQDTNLLLIFYINHSYYQLKKVVLKHTFHKRRSQDSIYHFYYCMAHLSKLLGMHNKEFQFEYNSNLEHLKLLRRSYLPVLLKYLQEFLIFTLLFYYLSLLFLNQYRLFHYFQKFHMEIHVQNHLKIFLCLYY